MNLEKTKLDCIFGRRSIRLYTDKSVDEESIQTLLQAAMAAPSARACDPWRFLVLTQRNVIDSVSELLPYGKMLKMAPLAIVVCGDITKAHSQSLSYMLQDCSAATENILIAAHVLGLGGVWLGVHPNEDRMAGIRKLFTLPEEIIPVNVLSIGYPAEVKEPRTRYNAEYVHHNRW
ncbi:MAG TPA: nitroreductase family protein [Verrucomicrobiota bacterium]|jgi:nitroreductase|nr:nitroreductase family protein [Verrucomicrobiota bacterium]